MVKRINDCILDEYQRVMKNEIQNNFIGVNRRNSFDGVAGNPFE